jgi:hypothetical protein
MVGSANEPRLTGARAMRTMIAFYVAPLVAPLITALYLTNAGVSEPQFSLLVAGSGGIAYAGALVLGAPIYLFLRAQNATSFVIAPVVGLIVQKRVYARLDALCAIMTDVLSAGFITSGSLQFGALIGAAVGAVFWLIDRPDCQSTQP